MSHTSKGLFSSCIKKSRSGHSRIGQSHQRPKLLLPLHLAIFSDLVTSKSQDGCSPASVASAFQARRRRRADGKKTCTSCACSLSKSFLEAQFSDFCLHLINQNCVMLPPAAVHEAGKCSCLGGACWHPEYNWNSDGKYFEKNYVPLVSQLMGLWRNKINEH